MAKKKFRPPPPYGPKPAPPRYQSVDEINAIYNMFLQNYERVRMEGQRAANLKENFDQYINRGFRDPIEQPVAPQFRYPTAKSIGAPPPQGPMPSPNPGPMLPGVKVPSFTPPPRLPSPSMPLPPTPFPTNDRGGDRIKAVKPQPINLPDKLPLKVSRKIVEGQNLSDQLPPKVTKFVNQRAKKPTLNSFIPRYERD